MINSKIQYFGSFILLLAVLNSFCVSFFHKQLLSSKKGSIRFVIFYILSEVEILFGFWASLFLLVTLVFLPIENSVQFLTSLNFTEPLFIFTIMLLASCAPVIDFAERLIYFISRKIPIAPKLSFYFVTLSLAPVLGSVITEPAAMTVAAAILVDEYFKKQHSLQFRYATLGLLFVNISIGGTLTHFAAPPVVMVAQTWKWDSLFMFKHFGYKAIIGILISTSIYSYYFRNELKGEITKKSRERETPYWLIGTHLMLLGGLVLYSHNIPMFILLIIAFFTLYRFSRRYQVKVNYKGASLVAVFLSGLVILGSVQGWWLSSVIGSLSEHSLFVASTMLTGITDNALITYLGTKVSLSESAKYFLMAGAVTGGGLTVIANAPNPIGVDLLKKYFPKSIISPIKLLVSAAIPTFVAFILFLILPNL